MDSQDNRKITSLMVAFKRVRNTLLYTANVCLIFDLFSFNMLYLYEYLIFQLFLVFFFLIMRR